MPLDILTFANVFDGVELAILVYVLMQLQHVGVAQQRQGAKIEKISERTANILGRLGIASEDDE